MIPFFPFVFPRETCQGTYTNAVVGLIAQGAAGSVSASADKIAVREIALGLWGRAVASADVPLAGVVANTLTPGILALIGRELIRRGVVVVLTEIVESWLTLQPANAWDLTDATDLSTWTYEITWIGPTCPTTLKRVSALRVIRVRHAVDLERPWQGVVPLERWKTKAYPSQPTLKRALVRNWAVGGERDFSDGKSKGAFQEELHGIKGNPPW